MLRISHLSLIAFVFVSGCGLLPRYEYEEAKVLVPSIREYALNNIQDLSKEDRDFIYQTEPVIRHANYVIYYYRWQDKDGQTRFCVEAAPPSSEVAPTRAYRINTEKTKSPYKL